MKRCEEAVVSRFERGEGGVLRRAGKYGLLVVLSVFWGLAFVAIRSAVAELSPVSLALLRWLIASACFLVVAPFVGKSKAKFNGRDLPRLLAVALLMVPLYHLSLNFAETTVPSSLAGLLSSLGPVLVAVLSALLLKERIGGRLVLALFLGLLGAAIISLPNLDLSSVGSILGPLGVFLAVLSYALFAVLSKPLVQKYGSVSVTIWAGLAGTLMLLPFLSEGFTSEIAKLSMNGWLSVLYLSLFSTFAGYLLFYTLVSRETVSKLSIQLYLIPVISVFGGILLLHESVNINILAGGAILLLSVALATTDKNK
ncbi:MAG: DMT family transporter [Candidatus Bathyarchaeia archaeon]